MSFCDRFNLLDPVSSTLFYKETSIGNPALPSFLFPFCDELVAVSEKRYQYGLDTPKSSPFEIAIPCSGFAPVNFFDVASDLVQTERCIAVRSLAERVAALEMGFRKEPRDRRYKWTTEIKGEGKDAVDRTYKLVVKAKAGGEKDLKWMEEIKGRGKYSDVSKTNTFQAASKRADGWKEEWKVKKGKKEKNVNKSGETRVVEITDTKTDQGAIFLKKAFAKRTVSSSKGKKKELSPFDAAMLIQASFRAHMIRRSQVLRGLRELAVAKAKLKEIRALFSNFSYRHHVASDAEERQRFTEKIIVLLLTVDAIEGPDYMVRTARRSMVYELEAMLEIVDPQLPGRLGSLRRRKFDLPEGSAFSKEMALGVAEVVQLLNQEDSTSNA